MLINPFTPTAIAYNPDDFFGRAEELAMLVKSLEKGSVILDGPIGIGKSSLLSQTVAAMEGFNTEHHAKSVVAIGHKDIKDVDDAALLLLEQLVEIDEKNRSVAFKFGIGIPKVLGAEYERTTGEVYRNFTNGRNLAALQKIVERQSLPAVLGQHEFLVLSIDEADKCPVAIARLVRALLTYTQFQALGGVRFVLSGVSPFFQDMVMEDPGVRRCFQRNVTLRPLTLADSTDLLQTKLAKVASEAEKEGEQLLVHPNVVSRVVALSGGHPHILQLLGSHLVEHESDDPDGIIDSRDLSNSLRRVCYEDRGQVYESTLHMLDLSNKLDAFNDLLEPVEGFPTRIDQQDALDAVGMDTVRWLAEHNILVLNDDVSYGLVDEFLRIRMLLDKLDKEENFKEIELRILEQFAVGSSYVDDNDDLEDDVRIIGS